MYEKEKVIPYSFYSKNEQRPVNRNPRNPQYKNAQSNSNYARFKVYYDNNPKNRFESLNRICFVNKENGYITRMNEAEALKIITDISKALNYKIVAADGGM